MLQAKAWQGITMLAYLNDNAVALQACETCISLARTLGDHTHAGHQPGRRRLGEDVFWRQRRRPDGAGGKPGHVAEQRRQEQPGFRPRGDGLVPL